MISVGPLVAGEGKKRPVAGAGWVALAMRSLFVKVMAAMIGQSCEGGRANGGPEVP